MRAQGVGAKTVVEFLDAVFTLAPVVVEGKDLRSATGTVGDEETQVGARSRVFGFVADAALARPRAGALTEDGETALGGLGARIGDIYPLIPVSAPHLTNTLAPLPPN